MVTVFQIRFDGCNALYDETNVQRAVNAFENGQYVIRALKTYAE